MVVDGFQLRNVWMQVINTAGRCMLDRYSRKRGPARRTAYSSVLYSEAAAAPVRPLSRSLLLRLGGPYSREASQPGFTVLLPRFNVFASGAH